MVIAVIASVWLGFSLFFCLALGQAASRSVPRPGKVDDLIASEEPATCEVTPPATVSVKPTFADGLALSSCQSDQGA
jgi:hypothetical protein